MSAPIGTDRHLAAEVRRMTLNKIKRLFEMGTSEMSERELNLHDAVLQKLAGTVLPRLNEVTGEDGSALQVTLIKYTSPDGNTTTVQVPTEGVSTTPTQSV